MGIMLKSYNFSLCDFIISFIFSTFYFKTFTSLDFNTQIDGNEIRHFKIQFISIDFKRITAMSIGNNE